MEQVTKDWIKSVLKEHIATITFTKKDGTDRVMKCTLAEDWVPPVEEKETKRASSDESQAVWDTEAQGWRAFRWDSVKEVSITLE
jgi:hypothetical protein